MLCAQCGGPLSRLPDFLFICQRCPAPIRAASAIEAIAEQATNWFRNEQGTPQPCPFSPSCQLKVPAGTRHSHRSDGSTITTRITGAEAASKLGLRDIVDDGSVIAGASGPNGSDVWLIPPAKRMAKCPVHGTNPNHCDEALTMDEKTCWSCGRELVRA